MLISALKLPWPPGLANAPTYSYADYVKTPPEPRDAIRRMRPYEWEPPSASIARQAGVPADQVVRFDTNTFPWPGARLETLPPEPLNEYPDTSYATLTEAIAQYADVPTDRITVGAGADEILDLIAKAYIDASARVVLSHPTYPMFRILTEMAGGSIDEVRAIDLRLDRAAFLEHARTARLTWLCNPNNPTGEPLPLDYVEEVAVASDGVLVVDEAYFETSGVTAQSLVDQMPNVVISRTLSKGFGLAGVRVGYALAGPAISAVLRKVRPPGSISVVSAALGAQALSDLNGMRERVREVNDERARLRQRLQALGLEVRDSAANFLLIQAGRAAAPALLKKGLVVRTFPATSVLADYIRVTVRRPDENDRLLVALELAARR
jgi:histidinol-phosphate aminotransferase